jgi:hypothetical protein
MVVKTPVRVRIDEAMQVEVPSEGADEIVPFQVGLTALALDQATGPTRTDPF